MYVFVNRRQRDRRDLFLHPRIDLFRTRMAMHRLHDFVQHLPLMRHCNAIFLTKLAKRFGLVYLHTQSINDKYYRSVNIVIHSFPEKRPGQISSTAPSCPVVDRGVFFRQSPPLQYASRRSQAPPASSTAAPVFRPSRRGSRANPAQGPLPPRRSSRSRPRCPSPPAQPCRALPGVVLRRSHPHACRQRGISGGSTAASPVPTGRQG